MPSLTGTLCDIILVPAFLLCGIGTFAVLQSFTDASYAVSVLLAAGFRMLSLLGYRFISPIVRDSTTWLFFEWTIPVIFLAELAASACGSTIAPDVFCLWSESTNVQKIFIFIFIDIFTFTLLSSIFDHGCLGPYGTSHYAIASIVTSFSFARPQPESQSQLPSQQSPWQWQALWSHFWTGRSEEPLIPLTTNVSPPPPYYPVYSYTKNFLTVK